MSLHVFEKFKIKQIFTIYVISENIHSHPKEGYRKFYRGGGSESQTFSLPEGCVCVRGGGVKPKNLLWERNGYFVEQHNVSFIIIANPQFSQDWIDYKLLLYKPWAS